MYHNRANGLRSAVRYVRSAVAYVRSAVVNVRSALRNINHLPDCNTFTLGIYYKLEWLST